MIVNGVAVVTVNSSDHWYNEILHGIAIFVDSPHAIVNVVRRLLGLSDSALYAFVASKYIKFRGTAQYTPYLRRVVCLVENETANKLIEIE